MRRSHCQCVHPFAGFLSLGFLSKLIVQFRICVYVQMSQGQSQGHKAMVVEKTAFGKFTHHVCIFILSSINSIASNRLTDSGYMRPWTDKQRRLRYCIKTYVDIAVRVRIIHWLLPVSLNSDAASPCKHVGLDGKLPAISLQTSKSQRIRCEQLGDAAADAFWRSGHAGSQVEQRLGWHKVSAYPRCSTGQRGRRTGATIYFLPTSLRRPRRRCPRHCGMRHTSAESAVCLEQSATTFTQWWHYFSREQFSRDLKTVRFARVYMSEARLTTSV